MKRSLFSLLVLLLAACSRAAADPPAGAAVQPSAPALSAQPAGTPEQPVIKGPIMLSDAITPPFTATPVETVAVPSEVQLENYGPAPELANETWLNTPAPLRLADLRGKVVLLDMWTFG